jgi:hypothetical protein
LAQDWELIVASFQSQYGLRLSRDLHSMKWSEFAALLNGLDGKSPLGRVVSIRGEDDPDVLKQFTPQQRRIRSQWRTRRAKEMPQSEVDAFLESMKQALIGLAGGEAHE